MASRLPNLIGMSLLLASCGQISFESIDAGPDATPTDATPTDAIPADAIPADAIPADALPTDATPTDTITTDANVVRCFPEPGGASSLTLDAFEVEYTTPNTIRVRWDATDPSDQFGEYEILLMKSAQVDCDVDVINSTANPGLGYFRSPTPGHQLNATSLDQLEPATEFIAQLIVRDRSGGQLASELLTARTAAAPSEQVVLFSDEATAGYSIPSEVVFATGEGAFQGSGYYEFVSPCAEGSCFENLRRQDIDVAIANMSAEEFDRAYYEFAIAFPGTEHSYWSQARLSFTQADGSNTLFIYEQFVIEAGDNYNVYQIPIRLFEENAGTALLTYETARGPVFEFTVGGTWPLGATVRMDELRIRW